MNPEQRGDLLGEFIAALEREDKLRTLVRGMGPGSAQRDPQLWSEYLAAMDATTQASREYRAALK